MRTLTPQEVANLPQCKLDWMDIHQCLFKERFQRDPNEKDCLKCTLQGIYESLIQKQDVAAQHNLEVLTSIMKRKGLIE